MRCVGHVRGTLVVGDVLSPSVMLGGGLIATGLVNIAFGASSTLPLFCMLWAINGILQGFGAPSCAKILTSWFAAKAGAVSAHTKVKPQLVCFIPHNQ